MKFIRLLVLTGSLTLQSSLLPAQEETGVSYDLIGMEQVSETMNRFVIDVDNRHWDGVKAAFSDTVLLDYTSMMGGEPASLTANQIIDAWKKFLPGFDRTHHQLGNMITELGTGTAKVFCYVTATHYLKNVSGNNLWTVVGSYDAELVNDNNEWKITALKFNLKYTEGNEDLARMAMERIQ
jgi:hypothetical protein